ncbi:putative bifunctional diguanylate cyclase/phosphodiesterase [Thiopseudomonas denitrificans]|uniref:Diguanylate cyclase (GGDEF)-like protein n=1 Tax=Thiopseudomonas denitrificans TaxID=1501432 RepID=A0A4R6TV07_9GAMM|nr:EAL domain-containing protein [Thiopseudomonas denitrificans]TDQ37241.1 diguanylate cyclase (GGDEF)-like protein [Thiopseudomonas denitrificans]
MLFRSQAHRLDTVDDIVAKRSRRLLQISIATFISMASAACLAVGSKQLVLVAGLLGMLLSGGLAWRGYMRASVGVFLINLFVVLSSLIWISGGVRDMAMLGYPGLLVFAAVAGNAYMFSGLLLAILLYCSLLTVLTVLGHFTMSLPDITYAHIFFFNIIFFLTGFSVYILVKDMRGLMASLRKENQRVLEREKMITELARRDQLTGLFNRRDAEKRFALMMEEAHREGCQLAVYFIDLDNFKPVNDSLGHAAGDLLLQELSRRLEESLAPRELLYRFGGDEFLLVRTKLPQDPEQWDGILRGRSQQLLDIVSAPMQIMQNTIVATASVGVAIAPFHSDNFAEICRLADLAMYEAKRRGRNAFCLYHDDLGRASVDKFRMLKHMQDALEAREFVLWYQPKVCLVSGRVLSAEALLRWPQQDGSFISPETFIPLAEESGLIAGLGCWVAEQAIADCAAWQAQGFAGIGVSINVSSVQFRCVSLSERIADKLGLTGLSPGNLELELTESLLIDDDEAVQQELARLSRLGVGMAIDDFGTGYSNISYLSRFQAQRLKIDKSFIMPLADAAADDRLVRAMLQIAASLNFRVVAEGIETQDCLERLQVLGCSEGQGYLWSPAMPLAAWLDYLAANGACAVPPGDWIHAAQGI